MCATCGCGDESGVRVSDPLHHAGHRHPHDDAHAHHDAHTHEHARGDAASRTVSLEQDVLAKNNLLARRNRDWFAEREILAVNLMSSPGAGKTTLLERTVAELGETMPVAVIEGDQETLFDAERIKAAGCRVVQINTGAGCHLDAEMLANALRSLDPPRRCALFVENVGNLVCPALFDLGEASRIVIMSVTEGEDKPLKYPNMFRAADLVLLNKVDLLPYVAFDVDRFTGDVRRLRRRARVLPVSATRGDGLDGWYDWLSSQVPASAVR